MEGSKKSAASTEVGTSDTLVSKDPPQDDILEDIKDLPNDDQNQEGQVQGTLSAPDRQNLNDKIERLIDEALRSPERLKKEDAFQTFSKKVEKQYKRFNEGPEDVLSLETLESMWSSLTPEEQMEFENIDSE
ncbi:uncharacterized protein LOC132197380 [Neocloeon triangulifer]|uniref:uncharacterized protein LOC132197380 n=1 Tax=Neocloeon triangulifer TaxID=2078957 RepID=UPI00286F6567|nr:uncharacterized protein LOC132197380 [Neocloeon triangulifer]